VNGRFDSLLLKGVEAAVGGPKEDGVARDGRRRKNGADGKHFLTAENHVVIEKIEIRRFVFGRAVVLGVVRGVLLSAFGVEGPGEFLSSEIDGEKAAVM